MSFLISLLLTLCPSLGIVCEIEVPSWVLSAFTSCFLSIRLVTIEYRHCLWIPAWGMEPVGLYCVCWVWPSWEDSPTCTWRRSIGYFLGLQAAISLAANCPWDFQHLLLLLSLVCSMNLLSAPVSEPVSQHISNGSCFQTLAPSRLFCPIKLEWTKIRIIITVNEQKFHRMKWFIKYSSFPRRAFKKVNFV